ncbi:MAG: hypothetical protein U0Q22_03970 [Acidimicrobiales bacterium]
MHSGFILALQSAVKIVVLALVAIVAGSGCEEARSAPMAAEISTTSARRVLTGLDGVAERYDCVDLATLFTDSEPAPIRGGAAVRGVSCKVHGSTVHIFERSPVGPGATLAGGRSVDGSMQNVLRVVQGGVAAAGCEIRLLVTPHFIALTADDALLARLEAELGQPEAPIITAAPTVSYLPTDCSLP